MTTSSQPSRVRRASGWTDERRARHAAAIHTWAPWKQSTGPRTPEGKHISSLNALKHGDYSRPAKKFYRHLRLFLLQNRLFREKYIDFNKNELLKERKRRALKKMLKRSFKKWSRPPRPPKSTNFL